jgi:hypothetical protein
VKEDDTKEKKEEDLNKTDLDKDINLILKSDLEIKTPNIGSSDSGTTGGGLQLTGQMSGNNDIIM